MKYLLLVSHGGFAQGLKTSLAMFAEDKVSQVIAVGLENGKSVDDFAETFRQALSNLKDEDSVVVLADIVGGSPLTTACNVLADLGNKIACFFINSIIRFKFRSRFRFSHHIVQGINSQSF